MDVAYLFHTVVYIHRRYLYECSHDYLCSVRTVSSLSPNTPPCCSGSQVDRQDNWILCLGRNMGSQLFFIRLWDVSRRCGQRHTVVTGCSILCWYLVSVLRWRSWDVNRVLRSRSKSFVFWFGLLASYKRDWNLLWRIRICIRVVHQQQSTQSHLPSTFHRAHFYNNPTTTSTTIHYQHFIALISSSSSCRSQSSSSLCPTTDVLFVDIIISQVKTNVRAHMQVEPSASLHFLPSSRQSRNISLLRKLLYWCLFS